MHWTYIHDESVKSSLTVNFVFSVAGQKLTLRDTAYYIIIIRSQWNL